VWEFYVRLEKRRALEKAYGPNGDWAKLFRQAEGYIRTELIRDPEICGRYVTLDFWTSRVSYLRFKRQNLAAYKVLDKRCKLLTQSETLLGHLEKAVWAHLIWGKPEAKTHTIGRIRRAVGADVPAMIAMERSAPSAAHWSEAAYHDLPKTGAPRRLAFVSVDN